MPLDVIVPQGNDGSAQPSAGHDLVPVLQIIQHLLPLLLAPLLRHDQQKIKNREDENERSKTQPTTRSTQLNRQYMRHVHRTKSPNIDQDYARRRVRALCNLQQDFSFPQAGDASASGMNRGHQAMASLETAPLGKTGPCSQAQ
jgi:hypothetical protein